MDNATRIPQDHAAPAFDQHVFDQRILHRTPPPPMLVIRRGWWRTTVTERQADDLLREDQARRALERSPG
jgi:hypothetical protein